MTYLECGSELGRLINKGSDRIRILISGVQERILSLSVCERLERARPELDHPLLIIFATNAIAVSQ